MWCGDCQQDVPGVARPGGRGAIVCPRCASPLLLTTDYHSPRRRAQKQPGPADLAPTDLAPTDLDPADFDRPRQQGSLDPSGKQGEIHLSDHIAAYNRPLGNSAETKPIANEPIPQDSAPQHAGPAAGPASTVRRKQAPQQQALDTPIFEVDDSMPSFDDIWDTQAWDEVSEGADELLRAIGATRTESKRRVDEPHAARRPHISPPLEQSEPAEHDGGFFASRVTLLFGGLTLTAGAVVLAWGQTETFAAWRVAGIVAGAIGQLVVIIGLCGILMSLWQANRTTRKTLSELDSRIQNIQRNSHPSDDLDDAAARSFYSHYGGGANSRTLMADLQGQMKLLAQRIRDDERAA